MNCSHYIHWCYWDNFLSSWSPNNSKCIHLSVSLCPSIRLSVCLSVCLTVTCIGNKYIFQSLMNKNKRRQSGLRFTYLSGIQHMYLPFERLCWIINKVGSPQLNPVALPWGDCWLSSLFEHCFPTETSLQHTLHSHVFSKLICIWQKRRSEKEFIISYAE